MDYQKWIDCAFESADDFAAFEAEMIEDLKSQLAANGVELLKTLPNQFRLGAIAVIPNKWIHITVDDVRNPGWFDNVKLRRMSSERDWKGEDFHFCTWSEVGAAAAKYLGDEYDDEAF